LYNQSASCIAMREESEKVHTQSESLGLDRS
jgi:hypothetical protein